MRIMTGRRMTNRRGVMTDRRLANATGFISHNSEIFERGERRSILSP